MQSSGAEERLFRTYNGTMSYRRKILGPDWEIIAIYFRPGKYCGDRLSSVRDADLNCLTSAFSGQCVTGYYYIDACADWVTGLDVFEGPESVH